jgi:FMN-dependent NADH-azoreductase
LVFTPQSKWQDFGPAAQLKAYIDDFVRVGRTFGLAGGDPYWPLLSEYRKRLIILSSRGDYGYDEGGRIAALNHVEPSVRTALQHIGITRSESLAAEYDEFADDRLQASLARAEGRWTYWSSAC